MTSIKTRADLFKVPGFHELSADSSGNPCVWENQYQCTCDEDLPAEWDDVWSCKCNDRCPVCNTETEPFQSNWIGPDDEALRALWEQLPDAGCGDTWKHADRRRRPSLSVGDLAVIYSALNPGDDTEDRPDHKHLRERIELLLKEELDSSHRHTFDAYRAAVTTRDGELECDGDAEVSIGDDGAYVMVWQWVYNHQVASLEREQKINCASCGDETKLADSPDDERCPDCYDREEGGN